VERENGSWAAPFISADRGDPDQVDLGSHEEHQEREKVRPLRAGAILIGEDLHRPLPRRSAGNDRQQQNKNEPPKNPFHLSSEEQVYHMVALANAGGLGTDGTESTFSSPLSSKSRKGAADVHHELSGHSSSLTSPAMLA